MEIREYKCSFGIVKVTIDGDKCNGTYQNNGKFNGTIDGNIVKAEWNNEGQEGLIELDLSDDKLVGRWKQGLDEGPMRGKWAGSLLENSALQSFIGSKLNTTSTVVPQGLQDLINSASNETEDTNNQFDTVKIGNQEWMSENLNVAKFRNGDTIPIIENDAEWEKAGNEGRAACCFYNNDPTLGEKNGRLYNWFAVNDERGLAPEGWHVPSNEDWSNLESHLGEDDAGDKMKSTTTDWLDDGEGTNESGFNAFPCGKRVDTGVFLDKGFMACYWDFGQNEYGETKPRCLDYEDYIGNAFHNKSYGFQVRCLKD